MRSALDRRIFSALSVFGPATDADLVARLRGWAERQGRSVSAATVLAARQRLVRRGLVVAGPLDRATSEGRATRRWMTAAQTNNGRWMAAAQSRVNVVR